MKIDNLLCADTVMSKLKIIYGDYYGVRKAKELIRTKRRLIVTIMMVTLLLAIIVGINSRDSNEELIESIERNSYGGGSKVESLIVQIGDTGKTERISVNISEKKYSNEDLSNFEESLSDKLYLAILGNNKSLDEVTTDLNLVKQIQGYPFNISWKSEKPLLVDSKGIIDKENIEKEIDCNMGIPVKLCATLTYDDYRSDIYFYIILKVNNDKNMETFMTDVNKAIQANEERDKAESIVELPGVVDGIQVSYKRENTYEYILVLILGVVCAFGMCIAKDKEIDHEIQKRKSEMDRDYPQILNQYALYYCAGMNHRAIWQEICNKYESDNKGGKRFAYEEMLVTNRKLQEGVGELNAYEEFAKRCQNVKYRAFVSLIEQWVQKGGNCLDILLEEEIDKAYKEENNRVRLLAQELSTKLLVPMIMMLVIVLVIVMVPAFISFNG